MERELTDDPLVMCEMCGHDILLSEATFRDAAPLELEGPDTDGRVPLCPRCNKVFAILNECPDD